MCAINGMTFRAPLCILFRLSKVRMTCSNNTAKPFGWFSVEGPWARLKWPSVNRRCMNRDSYLTPDYRKGPLLWYNCLPYKESQQGQVVNTYTAIGNWIPWSNIKDSAGVIYVPSPYFSLPPLNPHPTPWTILTHLNQKRPISSDRTGFAWNILIFPYFKELGVKLIKMITNSRHWTQSRASSVQYTFRTPYF